MPKFLLLFTLLTSSFSSFSQWKTIYEAGYGTPLSLRYDCKSLFKFSGDPASNENIISFNITEDQNRIGMNAYLSPFNDQCELIAGIHKFIPEMGQYASLRVYLDLNLPDSVGTVYYATIPDSVFNHPTTLAPLWTDFASDIQSTPIYFSNFVGNKTLYIYSKFDVSPGTVFYNYLRIEADTTQVLNAPNQSQPDFRVFSSGKELQILTSFPDANYEVQVFDLSGKCIYREQKSGSQNLPIDYSKGIYLVLLTHEDLQYQTKIYLE